MRKQGSLLLPFPSPSITIIRGAPADRGSCKSSSDVICGEHGNNTSFPPPWIPNTGRGCWRTVTFPVYLSCTCNRCKLCASAGLGYRDACTMPPSHSIRKPMRCRERHLLNNSNMQRIYFWMCFFLCKNTSPAVRGTRPDPGKKHQLRFLNADSTEFQWLTHVLHIERWFSHCMASFSSGTNALFAFFTLWGGACMLTAQLNTL